MAQVGQVRRLGMDERVEVAATARDLVVVDDFLYAEPTGIR